MGWREDIGELPREQRQLIEGGELSQRFSRQPLGVTHPALIGGFYGFLVTISLMLPFGYQNGWSQDTLRDWAFLGTVLILILAITGHASLMIGKILRRPPVSLPRPWVFPMPFIGLSITSVFIVTEIENQLPSQVSQWLFYIGWVFLLIPGPIYIHLSWAPRWRILCRLEEGLDPFEGNLPEPQADEIDSESDNDLDIAIDSLEDDPPLLYQSDSEE
ncbi:MAG: hypothetical protein VYA86_00640 [Candidatus Thermoplasmatota archaeon]|nr:hypothetical protein [Candidatus Thermoplasmatota archaeon]